MGASEEKQESLYNQLIKPFVDLIHAPKALWGVNLGYVIEGVAYWGFLGYLAIHFSDYIFQGVEHADVWSHDMVGVLTAGITLAMLFLGFVCDKWGIRRALITAFIFLLMGRLLISSAPTVMGLEPQGLWSPLHLVTMAGILLVVIGYGMYQPSAYAAVRKFTNPKTAAMGFAMLYALMNLGGWLPSYAFLLRDEDFLNLGIPGVYWVYTFLTLVALFVTIIILTRKTVEKAMATAKAETEQINASENKEAGKEDQKAEEAEADKTSSHEPVEKKGIPIHFWIFMALVIALMVYSLPEPYNYILSVSLGVVWLALIMISPAARWLARHPLADSKFFFFIFALIPVQTLFTYNWLVLPQYISRSFEGWIGDYFEIFSNANPLLIFVFAPAVAAITTKVKVYKMMILGTFVMAAPTFLLVIGPFWWTLIPFIVILAIGEAMWQPRFLQYAAEIAPEGRTGEYMGVAQLPWFLTKVLVPLFYSGWMMERYCPAEGPQNTEFMWLIYGCIAMSSTVMLILAKNWVGKDFKTKAD